MNRNALPLVELTMLPVPVLELALPEWTTAPPASPPEFGKGNREVLVSRAMGVASSLATGNVTLLPPVLTNYVNMLHVGVEACRDPGNRRAWTAAVTELSKQTMAFLPYDQPRSRCGSKFSPALATSVPRRRSASGRTSCMPLQYVTGRRSRGLARNCCNDGWLAPDRTTPGWCWRGSGIDVRCRSSRTPPVDSLELGRPCSGTVTHMSWRCGFWPRHRPPDRLTLCTSLARS